MLRALRAATPAALSTLFRCCAPTSAFPPFPLPLSLPFPLPFPLPSSAFPLQHDWMNWKAAVPVFAELRALGFRCNLYLVGPGGHHLYMEAPTKFNTVMLAEIAATIGGHPVPLTPEEAATSAAIVAKCAVPPEVQLAAAAAAAASGFPATSPVPAMTFPPKDTKAA